MLIVNTRLPKMCFARPGQAVRLAGPDGKPKKELYIVSVFNNGQRAMRDGMTHGLYDEKRPLFLVNLETGEAVPMPHLSSRVQIVHSAAFVDEEYQGDTA